MDAAGQAEASRYADLKARVRSLEGWQKAQNGSIQRVERKVDRLQYWLMGALLSSLLAAVGGILSLIVR